MSQVRRRQLARLERLAKPYIEAGERWDAKLNVKILEEAKWHAIDLGFLILFGEPKRDEPLLIAWQRGADRFGHIMKLQPHLFPELNVLGMSRWFPREIAERGRETVMSLLPGGTEKDKFQHVLTSAPPWLLWMTSADLTADVLGLRVADLSVVEGRSGIKRFKIWPALPKGTFERYPVSTTGIEISVRDWLFFKEMKKLPEEEMSRLDRKRFFEIARRLLPAD